MNPLVITLIVLGILILWVVLVYNGLVQTRNAVKQSWSGIDVQLKKRADVVPNLVKTVKGYAKHEKELLENITKARSSLLNAKGDVKKAEKADLELTSALKTLFAVSENYPTLKANENFLKLQEQLSDIEDTIAAARRIYNENVVHFTNKIQIFPNNILAKQFSFTAPAFFEAQPEEREAVSVEF